MTGKLNDDAQRPISMVDDTLPPAQANGSIRTTKDGGNVAIESLLPNIQHDGKRRTIGEESSAVHAKLSLLEHFTPPPALKSQFHPREQHYNMASNGSLNPSELGTKE